MEKEKKLIEDAGVIALGLSKSINPKLTAQEQAFFIAGFQECIKYQLNEKSIKIDKPGTVEPIYRGADEDEKIAFIRGWIEKYGDKEYATKEHLVNYIKGLIK